MVRPFGRWLAERLVQLVAEHHAVGQPRERILMRQDMQLLVGMPEQPVVPIEKDDQDDTHQNRGSRQCRRRAQCRRISSC